MKLPYCNSIATSMVKILTMWNEQMRSDQQRILCVMEGMSSAIILQASRSQGLTKWILYPQFIHIGMQTQIHDTLDIWSENKTSHLPQKSELTSASEMRIRVEQRAPTSKKKGEGEREKEAFASALTMHTPVLGGKNMARTSSTFLNILPILNSPKNLYTGRSTRKSTF